MESSGFSSPAARRASSGTGPQHDHAKAYAALVSMVDAVYCVDPAGHFTFAKGSAPVRETVSMGEFLVESVGFALREANVRADFHIAEDLWALSPAASGTETSPYGAMSL
jgi:hypothetical protein